MCRNCSICGNLVGFNYDGVERHSSATTRNLLISLYNYMTIK